MCAEPPLSKWKGLPSLPIVLKQERFIRIEIAFEIEQEQAGRSNSRPKSHSTRAPQLISSPSGQQFSSLTSDKKPISILLTCSYQIPILPHPMRYQILALAGPGVLPCAYLTLLNFSAASPHSSFLKRLYTPIVTLFRATSPQRASRTTFTLPPLFIQQTLRTPSLATQLRGNDSLAPALRDLEVADIVCLLEWWCVCEAPLSRGFGSHLCATLEQPRDLLSGSFKLARLVGS